MNHPFAPPLLLAFRLLRWFCKPRHVETIEGDLWEIYEREYRTNTRKAKLNCYWNTIRFLRWRYIKNLEDFSPQSPFFMMNTYFKVTYRAMQKNKVQAALNIFGLSVGIACCLLMFMHVRHQLQYDKHIVDLDNIYRVTLNGRGPYTPARLVKQMREEYPEIAAGSRVSGPIDGIIEIDGWYVKQEGGIMADSTFFDVFPTRFIRGEAKTALNGPNYVVLTESTAFKIFAGADPIGKVVKSSGNEYQITAIVADPPASTTIPYQFILSIPFEFWATTGWWTGNNFFSYLKLTENADPIQFEAKFPDFVERHIGPEILSYYSKYSSFEEYVADGNSHFFKLTPMKDVHLHHPRLSLGIPGSYVNMLIFSGVAAFILIIACFNYINMSTARSSLRAKEIGMRKVMGSTNYLIAQQFLAESLIITGLAVVLGLGIAMVALPYFNVLADGKYVIGDMLGLGQLGWTAALLVGTGILAGSYPAIYLASFKPIAALKGETVRGGNTKVRSGLVVMQFAISLFLMIATVIVYQQVTLMNNRHLGLDAEQVYVIDRGNTMESHYSAFKAKLLSNSNIQGVGVSSGFPSSFLADWNYSTVGDDPVTIAPLNIFASSEIREVWGLNLLQGRFFSPEISSDSNTIVVNKKLVETLGWDDPIGQMLSRGPSEEFRVIGVVDNFSTGSAKRGETPMLFRYRAPTATDYFIMIKISGNYSEAISYIEDSWHAFIPNYPVDGIFMDDSFERLYKNEERFGMLFTGFSSIAIVIACIGLFALASFTLERKRKEMALRKVLGAKVSQLFAIVCKDFVKLIIISAVIAIPVSYYLGENWLQEYVDRIVLGWDIFAVPLIALLAIALATISYQTYKSALNSPVEALKEE